MPWPFRYWRQSTGLWPGRNWSRWCRCSVVLKNRGGAAVSGNALRAACDCAIHVPDSRFSHPRYNMESMRTNPPRPVALNDLLRQTTALQSELEAGVNRVLASGWYILGRECTAFESEFAAYCGVAHCISVANGTDGLELSLRSLGIGPGDAVATVANAGGYSTTAIRALGAEPLYIDIDPSTMNMSAADLAARLTPAVRAVIATHLYGRMALLPALLAVTGRAAVPLVEDCAQAHGAALGGKKAGSWGALACFSFYPTKNLGALGDGGAITTNDGRLAQRVISLRQYGWSSKYRCSEYGRNSRMDEMQAAILRAKLPHLDGWNARRREIAATYSEHRYLLLHP